MDIWKRAWWHKRIEPVIDQAVLDILKDTSGQASIPDVNTPTYATIKELEAKVKAVKKDLAVADAARKKILDSLQNVTFQSPPRPISFSNGLPQWVPSGPSPTYTAMSKDEIDKKMARLKEITKPAKPVVKANGMSGFSEEGAPDEWDMAVGEVYGYRWWKLAVPAQLAGFLPETPSSPDGGVQVSRKLIGANHQEWAPGRNEAVCTAAGTQRSWDDLIEDRPAWTHQPPEIRVPCGCGFWAYFSNAGGSGSHFGNLAGQDMKRGWIFIPVFGVVKGTGRVIIGENGFRSQYAEIVGLALPEQAKKALSSWSRGVARSATNVNPYEGNPGAAATYQAMTGHFRAQSIESEPADEAEVLRRLTTVETMLEATQPQAKIFTDTDALRKYFPPDKTYG